MTLTEAGGDHWRFRLGAAFANLSNITTGTVLEFIDSPAGKLYEGTDGLGRKVRWAKTLW